MKPAYGNMSSRVRVLVAICVAFLISCASAPERKGAEDEAIFGDTDTLNYEYTNRTLADEARDMHYRVNTEIDAPEVIRVVFPEIGGVHVAAPVCGSAIVRFVTDPAGKIVSYRFIRRAGVGLDDYVERMIAGISVKPLVHKGEKSGSEFTVRFVFRESQE